MVENIITPQRSRKFGCIFKIELLEALPHQLRRRFRNFRHTHYALVIVWIISGQLQAIRSLEFRIITIEITQVFRIILYLREFHLGTMPEKTLFVLISFQRISRCFLLRCLAFKKFLPLINASAIALDVVFVSKKLI